jgi:hypothetical protein
VVELRPLIPRVLLQGRPAAAVPRPASAGAAALPPPRLRRASWPSRCACYRGGGGDARVDWGWREETSPPPPFCGQRAQPPPREGRAGVSEDARFSPWAAHFIWAW